MSEPPSYEAVIKSTVVDIESPPVNETRFKFKFPTCTLPQLPTCSLPTCSLLTVVLFFCVTPFYWGWVEYWAPMAKMQSMQDMYQPCQCRLNSVSTTTFDFDVWCTDRHYVATGDRPSSSCLDGYIMDKSINQTCFGTKPSARATAPLSVCFDFKRSDYIDHGALVGGAVMTGYWAAFTFFFIVLKVFPCLVG